MLAIFSAIVPGVAISDTLSGATSAATAVISAANGAGNNKVECEPLPLPGDHTHCRSITDRTGEPPLQCLSCQFDCAAGDGTMCTTVTMVCEHGDTGETVGCYSIVRCDGGPEGEFCAKVKACNPAPSDVEFFPCEDEIPGEI